MPTCVDTVAVTGHNANGSRGTTTLPVQSTPGISRRGSLMSADQDHEPDSENTSQFDTHVTGNHLSVYKFDRINIDVREGFVDDFDQEFIRIQLLASPSVLDLHEQPHHPGYFLAALEVTMRELLEADGRTFQKDFSQVSLEDHHSHHAAGARTHGHGHGHAHGHGHGHGHGHRDRESLGLNEDQYDGIVSGGGMSGGSLEAVAIAEHDQHRDLLQYVHGQISIAAKSSAVIHANYISRLNSS